jgi:hypothetical protein
MSDFRGGSHEANGARGRVDGHWFDHLDRLGTNKLRKGIRAVEA